jgi:hypothetical protein
MNQRRVHQRDQQHAHDQRHLHTSAWYIEREEQRVHRRNRLAAVEQTGDGEDGYAARRQHAEALQDRSGRRFSNTPRRSNGASAIATDNKPPTHAQAPPAMQRIDHDGKIAASLAAAA